MTETECRERLASELRSVVGQNNLRFAINLELRFEDFADMFAGDGKFGMSGDGVAVESVFAGQRLELPPVRETVEPEIDRPNLPGTFGRGKFGSRRVIRAFRSSNSFRLL